MTISNEAVEAGAAKWWDLNTVEVEPFEALRAEEKRNVAENANIRELLEAAAPYMLADAGAKALEDAAAKVMGPSDVPLDGATCLWIAMELRERAAAVRGEG